MSTHIKHEDIVSSALLLADAVLTYNHEDEEDDEKNEFNYNHMIESAVDLINMVLTKHYTENRGSHLTPPQVLYLLSRATKTNKQTH